MHTKNDYTFGGMLIQYAIMSKENSSCLHKKDYQVFKNHCQERDNSLNMVLIEEAL
jgi:hypothetical protein